MTSEVPVIPEVPQRILVSEDISYEKYEGTVLKAILKVPHKKQVRDGAYDGYGKVHECLA